MSSDIVELHPASDDDDATIRTLPTEVLGPTPTPVVTPSGLPPTGGLSALTGDSSNLILLALIGLTLIGAFTFTYLDKILSLNGVELYGRLMLTGVIIVAAVLFQRRR